MGLQDLAQRFCEVRPVLLTAVRDAGDTEEGRRDRSVGSQGSQRRSLGQGGMTAGDTAAGGPTVLQEWTEPRHVARGTARGQPEETVTLMARLGQPPHPGQTQDGPLGRRGGKPPSADPEGRLSNPAPRPCSGKRPRVAGGWEV